MAAVVVLMLGGFVTLVLLYIGSMNNGAWAASPSDRRRSYTGAAVVFTATIGICGLVLWRGFPGGGPSHPR